MSYKDPFRRVGYLKSEERRLAAFLYIAAKVRKIDQESKMFAEIKRSREQTRYRFKDKFVVKDFHHCMFITE